VYHTRTFTIYLGNEHALLKRKEAEAINTTTDVCLKDALCVGAVVAATWVHDYAPPLRALVLAVTFLRNPWPAVPRWVEALIRPALFTGRPPESLMKATVIDAETPREVITLLREAVKAVKPAVWAARVKAIGHVDARTEFARVDVPILYLRGKRDRIVGPRMLKEMREIRPGMKVVVIDAPHQLLQCRPREASEAIKNI